MVNDDNKLNRFTSCESCKYVGFDSNVLGYCNNSKCKHYRHLVVNDDGSLVNFCTSYIMHPNIKKFKF